MARIARAVAPGLPHHVPQRGNRVVSQAGIEKRLWCIKDVVALIDNGSEKITGETVVG